ncbi:MAG: phosphoribosylamine--glycine ligase, partial [Prosthecobacter sp.]|nr:phosphoribosylamine--glycine ligase [Prosthecobacter sp.]
AAGLSDAFRQSGLQVFGPTAEAARLESSKTFAKEVMLRAGVRTASSHTYIDLAELQSHIRKHGTPIVLKADGLAAGKGVYVCQSEKEALEAAEALFKVFGSKKVVAEKFINGIEASFIVATNGSLIVPLATSHDYKRLRDGDRGPNTGGMGSVSPTPRLTPAAEDAVLGQVIEPVIRQMHQLGKSFQGFLYAGLMIEGDGKISVLEFNARLGDPETESILRRLDGDFCDLMLKLSEPEQGPLHVEQIAWKQEAVVCVVQAARGYPDRVETGAEIHGLDQAAALEGVEVFQCGTRRDKSRILTSGGRVLAVTASGQTQEAARLQAYRACDLITFDGQHYRKDISR